MALKFEELRVLKAAEVVADSIWRRIVVWEPLARDVVGKQMARAADSIGANIAEAYGRFHYGEKLQFLYYARGSLYETKYWLNRAKERDLMPSSEIREYASRLTDLARQLNAFASDLKTQRGGNRSETAAVREVAAEYLTDWSTDLSSSLFSKEELDWLLTMSST